MSKVEDLSRIVRTKRRDIDRRSAEARVVAMRGKELVKEVASLKHERDMYEKAASVLTSIGDERQLTAQKQIESLVTRGLQTIFGEELSFHVISDVKGKNPVVEFVVRTTYPDGSQVSTPVMDSRGGGVAVCVGFLLRLVVMLLSGKDQQHVLFLDESFSHVSSDFESRLAEFLREIVDRTGVQIVLVTHSSAYSDVADKLYSFSLSKEGYTLVRSGGS